MKTAHSISGNKESAWNLETRRIDPDEVQVVFAGRWCIDQDLPSSEVLHSELTADLRSLSYSAAGIKAWDSGLLAFLAALQKFCADRGAIWTLA